VTLEPRRKQVDTEIAILEMTSIRENGMDEYWLQDYIWNNPSCLGLGDV